MSTHIDPVPREARPFQGHRAGLVTRAAAGAIDLGILIIALGVLPRGLRISLSSRTPQLHRSDAIAWIGVCRRHAAAHSLSRGVLDG